MADMDINTPVFVNRDGGETLEGVVAFRGTVEFAEGDDWVGVRLTGSSAGQGKNDGSVQSKSYFNCPENCGLFVRRAALEVRKLSKIEELRLRRELASTGVTLTPPKATAATTPTTKAAVTSTGTTTPAEARKSRLEELRQRRAQITTDREKIAEKTASPQPSPARAAAISQQPQLTESPGGTAEELKAKDASIASLEAKLTAAETDSKQANAKVSDLQQQIQQLQQKLKVAVAAKSTEAATGDTGTSDDTDEERQQLQRENQNLEEQLQKTQEKVTALTKQIEKQKSEHGTEVTQLRSESLAYQNELQALSEQTKQRGVSDASHYKEKAKLQAQIAGLQREVQDLRNEKMDMESTLEDLSLDKDQLQEEKDALEERLEEMRIDSETAQMEVEELRSELEEAKASAERAGSTMELNAAAATVGGAGGNTESDDMAQALSVQNARLREALIRLREQTSLEKVEWTRQLKTVEKESENAKALTKKNESLEKAKSKLEEEVNELKDMVEQGAAFEGMVEDLSDKLMLIEEQNVELVSTIRELEESAELTSEMEEVLAQELKAAQRDVEDRETMIRNLEEAIKMQRKREEDFSKTVGNYRKSVETLKTEKEALMELQEGGEGEKSTLLASSQKALARAAQLVSDAVEMRKREAQAVLVKLDGQVQKHLADRLEKMLPASVAGREISAVKGELLVSKVTGMAAASLEGIAASCQANLRAVVFEDGGLPHEEEGDTTLSLQDEVKQEVANMFHQSECARELVDTSCFLLGLLAAGQWPDLVSEEVSLDLGLLMGHSVIDLEVTLRSMLKALKEEGVINSHQTNIDALRQVSKSTKQGIQSDLQSHLDSGKAFPMEWRPPSMELFDCISKVKFDCLGVGAALALVLRSIEVSGPVSARLRSLLKKVMALSTESVQSCARLVSLDVRKTDDVSNLWAALEPLKVASEQLLEQARQALLQGVVQVESLTACEALVDHASTAMSQFSSVLRSAKLNADETGFFHPLSPEAEDAWFGLARLASTVRSADGDGDDVNFLIRARSIEQRLSDAINNEPRLSLANAKVASLEKSLATRSKEIAMQNARLAELEKVLAKTSAKPSPSKMSAALKSSEELNSLKEENRMLMEAMDVLQDQVAGYENEIRFLKEMKSPKSSGASKDFRRKSAASTAAVLDSLKNVGKTAQRSMMDDMQNVASSAAVGALEATLFRPALRHARRDAAKWKSKTITSALLELTPLTVPGMAEGESKEQDMEDSYETLSRLSSALASYRMEQASVTVVDLQKCGGRSRAHLRASHAKKMEASARLESEAENVKRYIMHQGAGPVASSSQQLVGKLRILGKEPSRLVAAHVTTEDLYRLNLHVLR